MKVHFISLHVIVISLGHNLKHLEIAMETAIIKRLDFQRLRKFISRYKMCPSLTVSMFAVSSNKMVTEVT